MDVVEWLKLRTTDHRPFTSADIKAVLSEVEWLRAELAQAREERDLARDKIRRLQAGAGTTFEELRKAGEIGDIAPCSPYTFEQLLNRQGERFGLDLLFHIHVPKAGGGTVGALLRQNDFVTLDFDMSTGDFFGLVPEERFFSGYRAPPPPRRSYALTGHYRLDHPIFRRAWMPHTIVTTLRHPVERMLSYYNYTVRIPGNPWHNDVIKGMPFIEYARNAHSAFGAQYSFFDDTGQGTFAPTGTATPQQCLNNLVTRVGLYGLTERFDEFAVLTGYLLGRPRVLAVLPRNVTAGIPNASEIPPKTALTAAERDDLNALLKDDIWFYQEAVKEYERRVSDPRVQRVFVEALPFVRSCRESVDRVFAMRDPGDPKRRAFERV